MKENILDVLMYLFQNYMVDESEQGSDRESVRSALVEAGFPTQEIKRAFQWLDDLAEHQGVAGDHHHKERSFRIYTSGETARLDRDSRGFLLYLEQAGVLTPETRELVIDRVMALEAGEIDIDQLKWIILLVLFNRPGQEEAYAWMEDLLFEDVSGCIH